MHSKLRTGCPFLNRQRRLEYDEQEVWHHHYGLEPFRLWSEAALRVYQGKTYPTSVRKRRIRESRERERDSENEKLIKEASETDL